MLNKNTKAYQNKKRYNQEYIQKNCKNFVLCLNKNTDQDIIEFLESLPNKSAFIKKLIRENM